MIGAAEYAHKHGQFHCGQPGQFCADQPLLDRSGEQIGNDPGPHELERHHHNDKGYGDGDEDSDHLADRFSAGDFCVGEGRY